MLKLHLTILFLKLILIPFSLNQQEHPALFI